MEKPVIIEFAGISCSGKSTAFSRIFMAPLPSHILCAESQLNEYYRSVVKRTLFMDIKCPSPFIKVVLLCWVHLKHISGYKTFYRLCIKSIFKGDHKLKALKSVFFKLGKFLLLKSHSKGTVLMDEGVIQSLYALFVRSNVSLDEAESTLKELIANAPLPSEVIFGPDGPLNIITERMIKRGHHRVTEGSHSKKAVELRAKNFTIQSIQLQALMISELKGRLTVKVISDSQDWENVINQFRHSEASETFNKPISRSLALE